ncbi:hypothetical protein [Helicobacter bilis]|nr:hypothetical protein [Helicobacter bilis]
MRETGLTSSAPNEPTRSLLEVSAAVGECRIRDFSQRYKRNQFS